MRDLAPSHALALPHQFDETSMSSLEIAKGRGFAVPPFLPEGRVNTTGSKRSGGLHVGFGASALELREQINHDGINAVFMPHRQGHICRSSTAIADVQICRMTDEEIIAAEIRDWMLATLDQQGMTAASWAKRAEVSPTTVQRAIKPGYAFVTSSKTLSKLARAIGREPPNIKARSAEPVLQRLPVRYRVQAGHWIEVDSAAQDFIAEPQPIMARPEYGHAEQWLELVVGDSIDLRIPAGGFAHVVNAISAGREIKAGDLVVVERRRGGGLLCERTIKEVAFTARGKMELWPRSSNPKWSQPLLLNGDTKPGEDIEVEIVGLVIGSYSSFN